MASVPSTSPSRAKPLVAFRPGFLADQHRTAGSTGDYAGEREDKAGARKPPAGHERLWGNSLTGTGISRRRGHVGLLSSRFYTVGHSRDRSSGASRMVRICSQKPVAFPALESINEEQSQIRAARQYCACCYPGSRCGWTALSPCPADCLPSGLVSRRRHSSYPAVERAAIPVCPLSRQYSRPHPIVLSLYLCGMAST